MSYYDQAIRPQTPVLLNTQQVKDLITYLKNKNLNIVDIIGLNNQDRKSFNKTNEYYLYSAWLAKNNQLENSIKWYDWTFKPYPVNFSYDLRRII
jgi:hypothetical protein